VPAALARRTPGLVGIGLLLWGALTACSDDDAVDEPTVQAAAPVSIAPELEPNGSLAGATPLQGIIGRVRASLFPAGDVDVYSFAASAGDRLYATTVTSASVEDGDSQIEVLDPSGTVIASDDDDGASSLLASTVAGVPIAASGIHYIRVRHRATTRAIRPYELAYMIATAPDIAEIEPNEADAQAQLLHSGNVIAGDHFLAQDVTDRYAIDLVAGDTVFSAIDVGLSFDDLTIKIRSPAGVTGGWNNQVSKSLPYSVSGVTIAPETGRYYFEVSGISQAYRFAVGVIPADRGPCHTYDASNLPLPFGPQLAASTIEVPDDIEVGSLSLRYTLSHAEPAQVDLTLEGPEALGEVVLRRALHFTGSFIVDPSAAEAGLQVDSGYISTSLRFPVRSEPRGRAEWFLGIPASGTWTLRARDRKPSTADGALEAFGLDICEPAPEPECPPGTTAEQVFGTSFEGSLDGFVSVGTPGVWEHASVLDPRLGNCPDGASCFATNLSGASSGNLSSDLISPAIDLAGFVGPVTVSWKQRVELESASYDHASVDAFGGVPARTVRLWEHIDDTMLESVGTPPMFINESPGWSTHRARADALAGAPVRLRFHVDADDLVQLAGMAIDDVEVHACRIATCGDGQLGPGELCDDGNTTNGDGCDSNCRPTGCGNGVVTPGEDCDDGNLVEDDGCSSGCAKRLCGDGAVDPGEDCDDGNGDDLDGCDNRCHTNICGNGIVDAREYCDGGDGCGPDCAGVLVRDIEPNDDLASAQPLVFSTMALVDGDVWGSEGPDVFSFEANAGDLLTAQLGIGGSLVSILDSGGVALASGTGTQRADAPTTGTYYVKVDATTTFYRLSIHRSPASVTTEVEPNGPFDELITIPKNGEVHGTLTNLSDQEDYFFVDLAAGDRVSIFADYWPTFALHLTWTIFLPDGVALQSNTRQFTAPIGGRYLVRLYNNALTGPYVLTIGTKPRVRDRGQCKTYQSTGPAMIVDGGVNNYSITVPAADDGEITDVDVALKFVETVKADLSPVTLTAPAGNSVTLKGNSSPSHDAWAFAELRFDDDALQPLTLNTMPWRHMAQDFHSLTWFDAEQSAGTWKLQMTDKATCSTCVAQPKHLLGWAVRVCSVQPPPLTCPPMTKLETIYSTTFEQDDGGFTKTGDWARGTPTNTLTTKCGGGTKCFKAKLTGAPAVGTHVLTSPSLDLEHYVPPIRLQWKEALDVTSAPANHVSVEVGGTMIDEVRGAATTGWHVKRASLDALAGQAASIDFTLNNQNTNNMNYGGWTVDDVRVDGCRQIICGDSIVDSPETCDDGNVVDGDGCDSNCVPTGCGNGVVVAPESCDDGNLVDGDGCDANCTPTACANGVVTAGEECDDGNLVDGDGCDGSCLVPDQAQRNDVSRDQNEKPRCLSRC